MNESQAFVLKAVVIWAILSLPGNIATVYFYFWTDAASVDNGFANVTVEETNNDTFTTLNETFPMTNVTLEANMDEDSNITCYEKINDFSAMRENSRFWLEGIGITIVGIVGLAGNIMAILVLRTYTTNVSFNRLLMSLAVVDSLLIVDMIIQKAIIGNFITGEPLWYKLSYPFFWHPAKGMIQSGAIFMVVAVSAERYRAVCHPMSKRQACHKFVLFVLALAVVKNLPRYVQFQLIEDKTEYWTSPIMENTDYIRFSSYWDELFISGIVPLVSLVFFNTRIYMKIRSSAKFEYRFIGGNKGQSARGEKSRSSEAKRGLTTGAGDNNADNEEYVPLATRSENRDNGFEVRRLRSSYRMSEGNLRGKGQQNSERWADIKPMANNGTHLMVASNRAVSSNGGGSMPQLSERHLRLNNSEPNEDTNQPPTAAPGKSSSQGNMSKCAKVEAVVTCNGNGKKESSARAPLTGQFQFRKKKEKSTVILVTIVVLFILCHSYRLCLKIYEFAKPSSHVMDSFTYCYQQERYHVPVVMYILHNFHHLFLVFNSSANFVIYCFVAKDFRSRMSRLTSSFCRVILRRGGSMTDLEDNVPS